MDKVYYQPNHLWKGQKAVKKLKELSGEKPKTVKQWLSRQAFWQVHLPAPKRVDRPHYEVTIPNEMHQFDLLYMPSDTLYGNKYKYILVGIDASDCLAWFTAFSKVNSGSNCSLSANLVSLLIWCL